MTYKRRGRAPADIDSSGWGGAPLVVNILSDNRVRRADIGCPAVQDTWIHDVALELFFANIGGAGVAAQQDYDAIVDAIVVALRANPTPGGGDVVWSAGEFDYGIQHAQSEPRTSSDGITTLIDGVIRFQAWEWVSGVNV